MKTNLSVQNKVQTRGGFSLVNTCSFHVLKYNG